VILIGLYQLQCPSSYFPAVLSFAALSFRKMPSSEHTGPHPPHSTLEVDQNSITEENGLIIVPVEQEPLPQVAQSHLPEKVESDIAVSRDGKKSKRFARRSRVAAVLLLLLILGAVLGGVLGSRSRNNKSSVALSCILTSLLGFMERFVRNMKYECRNYPFTLSDFVRSCCD
jgi:hypothetical protein